MDALLVGLVCAVRMAAGDARPDHAAGVAEVAGVSAGAPIASGAHRSVLALAERFDPAVFDLGRRRTARIRLQVTGGDAWDVVVSGGEARVLAADGSAEAVLSADADAWRRIASDYRDGMRAYQTGRLSVRRNLHLGVGFLGGHEDRRRPGGCGSARSPRLGRGCR